MSRLRVAVTIDAPRQQVWEVVERIEDHVRWMGDAESITFTSASHAGVGTTFDCLTKVGPFRLTDRMEITEWREAAAMGVRHVGLVSGSGRFTLRTRRRGRTRFVWTERLRFPWWMGGYPGSVVAKPVMKAIWRRSLRRLKAIVEAAA